MVEENLWPQDDIPEDELNTLLEKQNSDIFVPAEVKNSLAQGNRININMDILGDCIIPDSMHSELDKRNYHPYTNVPDLPDVTITLPFEFHFTHVMNVLLLYIAVGNKGEGAQDISITKRSLTSAINYVVAVYGRHVILNMDLLPLQGLSWQTHVVSSFINETCTTLP